LHCKKNEPQEIDTMPTTPSFSHSTLTGLALTLALAITGCSPQEEEPAGEATAAVEEQAAAEAAAPAGEATDVVSQASEEWDPAAFDASKELPVRKIPNIPMAAEAYYAPDSFHLIAQTQDPDAQRPEGETYGGALTYIFTDDGEMQRRINDHGQDACSYFFPDQQQIVWTSTRDNMDMPLGDWSDDSDYPQGAELYISDLEGNDIRRLTDNEYYEAEVSISPNGEWIVFGRQIEGKMDLWRMRPDGSDEQQITFTEDWQEGAPFYLPDNETIMFRAWRTSVKKEITRQMEEGGGRIPTPMTVFTIKHDGSGLVQRTFDDDMNWAPYPAADGRHYVFVRIVDGDWEVYLGDVTGGEPRRLTYHRGFDGLPSLSPDGTKMLFARAEEGFGSIYTYVMDMSSLGLGPENWTGAVPDVEVPEDAGG
jgi:Tol biopolymer transport system component